MKQGWKLGMMWQRLHGLHVTLIPLRSSYSACRSVALPGRKIQRLGDLDGHPDFARHEGGDMPQCTLPKQNVVKEVQDFISFQKGPEGTCVTVFYD